MAFTTFRMNNDERVVHEPSICSPMGDLSPKSPVQHSMKDYGDPRVTMIACISYRGIISSA
jgi:hypothetical protein